MISFKSALPLIRGAKGRAVAFDPDWLRLTLASAATKAGYHGWWPVDDLVVGISFHFRHHYAGSVIDLTTLEKLVRGVLCDVGYQEVASRFQTVMPCYRVSLAEFLQKLPRNDRADFFDELSALVVSLHEASVQHFHFSDLHACVRKLQNHDAEARDTQNTCLLSDVIAFVRDRVQSLAGTREVWFSIS